MRITTALAITTCSLVLVGCNHLSRTGAQATMFEQDPFQPEEQSQRVAVTGAPADMAAMPPVAERAVDPAQNQTVQYQYSPGQPPAALAGGNIAPQADTNGNTIAQSGEPTHTVGSMAPSVPGALGRTSPAMRAEADVAAMLAKRHAQPGAGIQQTVHHVPPAAGSARFDYSEGGPPVFEPNPFGNNPGHGVVQAGHEQIQADGMPMLNPADLEVPVGSQTPPSANVPGRFPGAPGIPMPTGRAFMFSDEMLGEAATNQTPPQPAAQSAQSAFAPPTRQPQAGEVPAPVIGQAIPLLRAEPSSATPTTIAPQAPQSAPAQPAIRPVMRDSRSDSKWRAKRRM